MSKCSFPCVYIPLLRVYMFKSEVSYCSSFVSASVINMMTKSKALFSVAGYAVHYGEKSEHGLKT